MNTVEDNLLIIKKQFNIYQYLVMGIIAIIMIITNPFKLIPLVLAWLVSEIIIRLRIIRKESRIGLTRENLKDMIFRYQLLLFQSAEEHKLNPEKYKQQVTQYNKSLYLYSRRIFLIALLTALFIFPGNLLGINIHILSFEKFCDPDTPFIALGVMYLVYLVYVLLVAVGILFVSAAAVALIIMPFQIIGDKYINKARITRPS